MPDFPDHIVRSGKPDDKDPKADEFHSIWARRIKQDHFPRNCDDRKEHYDLDVDYVLGDIGLHRVQQFYGDEYE